MKTEDYAKTFNALGDKTRFKLFQLLGSNSEICVSQLAEQLSISPACVSQHMKILSEAGLVTRVRNGQKVCYQIANSSPSVSVLKQLIFKN